MQGRPDKIESPRPPSDAVLDAGSIVESYLRVNGFLTVREYPIIHRRKNGRFQEVTDIDVLGVRLPWAGRVLPRPDVSADQKMDNDPALGVKWGRQELVIAEVKEGVARLNQAMFRPSILHEALRRFGACPRQDLNHTVDGLCRNGQATLDDGTRVRLLAFASRPPDRQSEVPFTYIPLADVISFLQGYVARHWRIQNDSPFRDPVLRFLGLMEKGLNEDRQG